MPVPVSLWFVAARATHMDLDHPGFGITGSEGCVAGAEVPDTGGVAAGESGCCTGVRNVMSGELKSPESEVAGWLAEAQFEVIPAAPVQP